MNQLHRAIARRERDARYHVPEPRICACCGDPGEFDPFYAVHTEHHQAAMRREFGGDCCINCLDGFASCDRCDAVGFHGLDIKSQTFGDERLCADCEERA